MAIFFHWSEATPDIWQDALVSAGVEPDLRSAEAIGNPQEIDYAVVWAPPAGLLKTFENLRYTPPTELARIFCWH